MNQISTLSNISSELIIAKKLNSFKRFLQGSFFKLLLIMCCCAAINQSAVAQWSSDPGVNTPVCTLPGDQNTPAMVSDGAGGSFITWTDARNGDYDIYAQHINAAGIAQWQKNGIAIRIAAGNQYYTVITSDGAGGAIITWEDQPSSGSGAFIGAQRVNAAGEVQWATNGIPVNSIPGTIDAITAVSDGAGGAIITWSNFYSASYDSIRTQHLNAAGAKQWGANGILVPSERFTFALDINMISDDEGGAIIAWDDDGDNVYTQRINADGVLQWAPNGITIGGGELNTSHAISTDGAGGAIITYSSSSNDVYAQRVNAGGVVQWATNGIVVCNAAHTQFEANIVADAAGGAIITWDDFRSGVNYDVYAQRINAAGIIQWAVNGVAICTEKGGQFTYVSVSDGAGGAITTWDDDRNDFGTNDIYAQRINAAGVTQWTKNGVAIDTALYYQQYPDMVSDGAGGAIIAWQDNRNSNSLYDFDIYTQNVKADGTLGCVIPAITTQPLAAQTVCLNTTPQNLTVTATGKGLSYQWYADNNSLDFNGNAVNGETNTSFTPPTNTADTVYYYVIVTNGCGNSDTSKYAKVIVRALPVITASPGDNGTITPSGATTVNCDGTQTYSITPNSCYHIADVLIDGVSNADAISSGSYTFNNVQANHTISASFAVNQNTITASSGDNGTITPSGTTTINCGGAQNYTITSNNCYHIADVLIDGVSNADAINSGSYTFSDVEANHTIAATFAINQNTITASSGDNGSITPSGTTTINCSGAQTYTITPNSCYHIADVLVDGISNAGSVSSGSYTFSNVQVNHTISASFAINQNTITASPGANGTITPAGATTLNCGETQAYTITPNACYHIADVLVDGVSNAGSVNSGSYTFTNVQGNHTISASFEANSLPNAGIISGASSICVGSATTFTDNISGGTWSSSNTSVAAVNASSGIVTGVAKGVATIKYTVTGSCGSQYATKDITVVTAPNAGTIGCPSAICIGSTTTFTSTGNSGGTWSSSNSSVAKINASTGMVTGVAAGIATIQYTVTNSCGSKYASQIIIVAPNAIAIICPAGSPFTRNAGASCNYVILGGEFNPVNVSVCVVPVLTYSLSGATTGTGTSLTGVKLNKGTTTITWRATAGTLNATCSVIVNVRDVQPPSITCKPGANRTITGSTYTISGTEFNAGASDNCGTPSLIYSLSGATVSSYSSANTSLAGKKLNIGTTTITWKASDGSNNVSTCTTIIKVKKSNSASNTSIAVESNPKIPQQKRLTVQAAPNPSTSHFTLLINSSGVDKIDMMVFDLSGRKIEQKLNVDPHSIIQLGSSYFPGMYIVELKQGEQTVHLKLIKAE